MLFGHPELLRLLLLLPVLVIVGALGAWIRHRRLRQWADAPLWGRLAPARSRPLRAFRYVLFLVALGFGLLAAARPQVGAGLVQVERRGIDVVVALDTSLSMEATDVVPNRLDRSKLEIRELLEGLRGDRSSLVIFSGTSFLLCPLTLDVVAANLFLDAVAADVLPDPGTNLEEALRGARSAFGADISDPRGRVVVLFTDGESHEGDALTAARSLAEDGIPVLTVGVGTPRGEPIPVHDARGKLSGYKKDRGGGVVLSRLDEPLLREIARITGGRYHAATLQGREVDRMRRFLEDMERGDLGGSVRRRVDERFQVPAALAVIFFLLGLLVPEARRVDEAAAGYGTGTDG